MRPDLSTSVMGAFLAMDLGLIEERVKAFYGKTDLFLCIPSREVTTEWLQRFLGMKEVYARVTIMVGIETVPTGKKPTHIYADDILIVDSMNFSIDATPKDWTTSLIDAVRVCAKEEPVRAHYIAHHPYGGAPQSKGDRHRNRRYRWSRG